MCRNSCSASVLFYLGADLVYQWLVHASRRLLPLEYLSLLAIAVLIIYSGFVAGVLIGIVIGCATFALSASRVSAIKFSFDGSEFRSSLDRGPYELSLLADHGGELQGMALQSYLFFGSANRLYQHVKATVDAPAELPLSDLRFSPGDRDRFIGDPQLRADQGGSGRLQRASRAG